MKPTLVLAILACAYAASVPSGSTARLKGEQTGTPEKAASRSEALSFRPEKSERVHQSSSSTAGPISITAISSRN